METLGSICYIIIFTSLGGSVFTMLALFAKKALHLLPSLRFGLCGLALYLIPVSAPGLYLISPEETLWISEYQTACRIWLAGAGFFLAYYLLRNFLSYRAIKRYPSCQDERTLIILEKSMALCGMKNMPALCFGSLREPACVVNVFRPFIILKEPVIKQLSDQELTAVLCHELMHIKRAHPALQRIFELSCVVHWFNPLVWIARNELEQTCETDCDRSTLSAIRSVMTQTSYAEVMLRLLELSSAPALDASHGMGALSFLLARQRMVFILNKPSRLRQILTVTVLSALLLLTILFSIHVSRSYFYPYPGMDHQMEYADMPEP